MAPSLNTLIYSAPGDISSFRIQWLSVIAGAAVLAYLGFLAYRLFFHPLSKYPGPKLYALTHAPWIYKSYIAGSMAKDMSALHKKYGPIVRVAPDGLAVDGSIGFPQIFQHRPGKPEWSKKRGFYHAHDEHSLIGGTHETHRRLRRQLAHAFSDASMYEQEPVVTQYIDSLCSRMGEKAATGEVFDIVRWFNFTTFDIIGDLMFADSFDSLKGGDYHPWVFSMFEGVRGGARLRTAVQYPFLGPFIRNFGVSAKLVAKDTETKQLATEKAMARKALGEMPNGRKDFMTYMLKKSRDGTPGFSDGDLILNSPILVLAGSETTATTLSGMFYHLGLAQNRHVYDKLVEEILGAFASEEEIDMKTTARLTYLHAVIEENLRLFPPAAETPPRISPGATLNGEFVPKGTAVTVYQTSTFRNPDNFADPESFRPERWLPATHPLYNPMFANDNHNSFRPFSFGTRDCIGKNLAYSELRVVLCRLLHRFDYELAPGQEGWVDAARVFIVWEKPSLNVTFRERKTGIKA